MADKADKKEKKSEAKISLGIIKESFSQSFKNHKAAWIIAIIMVIIAVLIFAGAKIVNSDGFAEKAFDIVIPKQITTTSDSDVQMTFYRERNPEYTGEEEINSENLTSIYNFYYYNAKNEKIYVNDGIYTYLSPSGETETMLVAIGFLYEGGNRLTTAQTILNWVGWLLLAAVVVILIYVWYRKDKARQEAERKPKKRSH